MTVPSTESNTFWMCGVSYFAIRDVSIGHRVRHAWVHTLSLRALSHDDTNTSWHSTTRALSARQRESHPTANGAALTQPSTFAPT
eukprot:1538516-Rhodomonas_salina.1